ncbi:MAG: DUF2804 family protein [Myxococcaceae bacterium]
MPEPFAPQPPPAVLDAAGIPRFGRYLGAMDDVDLSALLKGPAGALRTLRRRRWMTGIVATPEVVCATRVMDLGPFVHAFAWAVDFARKQGSSRSLVLPTGRFAFVKDFPEENAQAQLGAGVAEFSFRRPARENKFDVNASSPGFPGVRSGLRLRAELFTEGAPSAVTTIAPVSSGVLRMTQKRGNLLTFGHVQTGHWRYVLDGGVGGMDYSQGIWGRQSAWTWAMALGRLQDGTPVTLNMRHGAGTRSDEVSENTVWLGAQVFPLAPVRFNGHPNDPLERSRIVSLDGALELELTPVWADLRENDWKWLKLRRVQSVGKFSGRLRIDGKTIPLEALSGVLEEQHALW